jgi:hypothetical protein
MGISHASRVLTTSDNSNIQPVKAVEKKKIGESVHPRVKGHAAGR